MKNFFKDFTEGVSAGICISLGCAVFLGLALSKFLGAVLFAVALLCICYKGYNLYTGRIGFIPEKHDKAAVSALLSGLLGNTVAVVLFGLLIRYAVPSSGEYAYEICSAKLSQNWGQTFIRGLFCGILMYLAVSIYRDKKTVIAIVFCIPAFILSGFEHSIADICYFAASGIVSAEAFGFLCTVIAGNTVGAVILPLLGMTCGKPNKEKEPGNEQN